MPGLGASPAYRAGYLSPGPDGGAWLATCLGPRMSLPEGAGVTVCAPCRVGAVLAPGPSTPRLIVAGEGQRNDAGEPQNCLSGRIHAPYFPTVGDSEAPSSGLRPLQPGKWGGHGRGCPSGDPASSPPASSLASCAFSARCGLSPRAALQGRDPAVRRQRAGVERLHVLTLAP